MLTLKEAQGNFFDRAKVIAAIGRAKASAMAKGGALVRTIARRSMRRRKKSSPSGSPPSSHVGLLRDFLFFSFDSGTESTVVGPTRIGAGTVPNLLEFGGTADVTDKQGVERPARYEGNPFMGPALTKAAPSLPSHWANSVRG